MNNTNYQMGLRIRSARKEKGLNQTELANLLGKSLRTIQKYESGEIEVSIAMINEIAKVLDTTSTYLIGYQTNNQPLTTLADVMEFFFHLDSIQNLGFSIDVKRPPHYDGWACSITFDGKDTSTELNQDLCLFLEEFRTEREKVQSYMTSPEAFQKWQDKTLAYYAKANLEEKEVETLTDKERLKRRNNLLNEQFGE